MVMDLLSCISFIHKDHVIMAVLMKEKEWVKTLQHSVYEKIERLLKCKLVVVTGLAVESPEQWHSSYVAAAEASRYRPLIKNKIWDYSDIACRKGGKTICTVEEEKELSSKLLEDDPIALKAWVQQYIEGLLNDPDVTPESLEAAIQSVAIAALRWLERVKAALGKQLEVEPSQGPLVYKLNRLPNEILFQHLYAIMKLYHNRSWRMGKRCMSRKRSPISRNSWDSISDCSRSRSTCICIPIILARYSKERPG